ncbi:MAG: ABC transporter ATP-binding protein [Lachnospiraceae bacterium]|nr:ABC transporter ATP-binding protein [Lachnospiraceae bacterium]
MQKFIIKTENVDRNFPIAGREPVKVLKQVSVEIPEKTLTILRGPSGSGKTTLMNILGALDAPSAGKVFFDGEDITKMSDTGKEKLRRKNVGFVFQSVSLIPMMTVYENVEFSLRLSGYSEDKKKRVHQCLKMVGLQNRADHMPQELSGGEQQRVAIARAIAHRPRVVFADEPTAELDSQTAITVVNIFKKLVAEEGVTIVMTTHDTGLMNAGDMVYTIEDGAVAAKVINKEELK